MANQNPWRSHLPTITLALISVVGLVTLGVPRLLDVRKNPSLPQNTPSPSLSPSATASQASPSNGSICATLEQKLTAEQLEARISRGERTLFPQEENVNLDRGIQAFSSENYTQAIKDFKQAVDGASNNPEAQIYWNNTLARRRGDPYVLAAVVPVTGQGDVAKEILRGVADAQTKFNKRGNNNRLLEIVVVDDGEPKEGGTSGSINNSANATSSPPPQSSPTVASTRPTAAQIACRLAANPNILGVIGHNSSDASQAALPAYTESQLAVVSPTTTSVLIESPVFFRTPPSDRESGIALAKYALALRIKRIAVFHNHDSSYSKSIAQEFIRAYEQGGGEVVYDAQDIGNSDFDGSDALKKAQESQAQMIALFPSSDIRSVAIAIANLNADSTKPLPLLGGDTLYHPNTLTNGGDAVQNLVVSAPCLFVGTQYAKDANNRWGGQISWRTACSYDAAQAFINTLETQSSGTIDRASILNGLKETNLSEEETSGAPLRFKANGDREGEPILVQAQSGVARPAGAQFGFKPIPMNNR